MPDLIHEKLWEERLVPRGTGIGRGFFGASLGIGKSWREESKHENVKHMKPGVFLGCAWE
jgi:hypothetical protein